MMMKTNIIVSVAALAAVAGMAMADGRVTITDAQPTTSPYNGTDGSGGAFTVTMAAAGSPNNYNAYGNGIYGDNLYAGDGRGTGSTSFLSFCLEYQDHLNFGGTYYTEISTSAYDDTAPTSTPNPDTLDARTAAIYREFRKITDGTASTAGLFGGALGSTLTQAGTTAIQQAIWFSEGEIGSISGAALAVYNWGVANESQGVGSVRVLRLWDNYNAQTGVYSGSHQDLLTMIPLPPSAYAGMGTLAGMLGLAAARRRKLAAE
ncbi:MAG: hypothetical protein NTV94_06285 [Planctomycetota bacterium]|nr:hypothetical protein [Planctomycetota bacterium]